MSEDSVTTESKQSVPELGKGLVAYGLYLTLMLMAYAVIATIMSKVHSVMIGPFGIFLLLMAILPAKNVFTAWKGMVIGSIGGVIAIFFDWYVFSWQENLPSMTTLNFFNQWIIYVYILVGAEGCLAITRKATGIKIRMFG